MANERIPDDDFYRSSSHYDRDLPPLDREFDNAPSSGKVALFAVAIALVLGAVFYGLNNTSTHQAQTPPPAQTAQGNNQVLPQAPPGMRDVTPRANTAPGQTTGAAPSQTTPPSTAPSTMNRQPAGNAPKE